MSKGKTHTWQWDTWSSTAIWLKGLFSFLYCLICFKWRNTCSTHTWDGARLHDFTLPLGQPWIAQLLSLFAPSILIWRSSYMVPNGRLGLWRGSLSPRLAGFGDVKQVVYIYVLQLSWHLQQRQSFSEGESLEHHIGPFSLPLAFSLCNYVCSLRVDHFSTCDHTTQSVPWYILFLLLGFYPVTGTHSTLLQTAITCWNLKKKAFQGNKGSLGEKPKIF